MGDSMEGKRGHRSILVDKRRTCCLMHLSCSVDVFSNLFALKSSREDLFTNLLQQPSRCATMAALRQWA